MKVFPRKVLILFIAILLLKVIISFGVSNPSVLSDEYIYFKLGESIHNEQTFKVNEATDIQYPPLYSLIISPAFFFRDRDIQFKTIQWINALLSSAIIFITYYFAKELINSEKKAFIATLIVALLPSNIIISNYIMSENLFYPISLLTIYLIWKSYKEENIKWELLAGITLGLCILTRTLGLGIAIAAGGMIVYKGIQKKSIKEIARKSITIVIAGILTSLWILRQWIQTGSVLGNGYKYIAEATPNEYKAFSFIVWIILYTAALITTSYIIYSQNFTERKTDNFKILSLLIITIGIGIAAYHSANYTLSEIVIRGRPITRYVNYVLPLIIIGGVTKSQKNESKLKYLLIFLPFLTIYPLFPFNNPNLTILGIITELTKQAHALLPALIVLGIAILGVLYYKKLNTKMILSILIISSIAATAVNIYVSEKEWNNNTQIQIAKEIRKLPQEVIVLDMKEEGLTTKEGENLYERIGENLYITLLDMKTEKKIEIKNLSKEEIKKGSIIITKKEREERKIKEQGGYKIYVKE